VQDWPEQAVLTRFPLYDESEVRPASERLEAFLRGGDKPVVITPGSANVQARRFIGESLAACARLNRRAVVVTQQISQLPKPLPKGVEAYEYLAFSRIFPRAAAVIHHGGIGTTAQCFAAGVPQLIMPMAHDQPDNAARVKRMGVGDYVYPRMFKWQRVAVMVERLVKSEEVQASCALVKRKMGEQMGVDEVVRTVSEMGERALRVREINGPGVVA
jgi:rhamnosyltransferase subunit B